MITVSSRRLWPAVILLAGSTTAVFITGTEQEWALVAFFFAAGLAALAAAPVQRAPAAAVVLGLLFLGATLLVQLPASLFPVPAWKAAIPACEVYSFGPTVVAVPAIAWWWTAVLASTILAGWVLLTSPLAGRQLALFLLLLAAAVGAYAVVSIAVWQTGWAYPYAEGGVFGLLPNRNHTATLLVLGSIVAFGLMQWELVHGHRGAATLAALCGAPSMAALLFFSISRAGILMLVAGFVLWAAGAARSAANRRVAAASALILVVFLVGLFVFGGSTVRDRLADLWQRAVATEAGQVGGTGDLDFRSPVFEDTLRMIAGAPLTGVGLGHFEPVFGHYRKASLREVGVLHPESSWLMVAAENGWPAVGVLAGLALWFLVRCWRSRGEDDGLLRWTVASAIAAALLHAFIDVPWHRPASGWFLLVAALVAVPPAGRFPRFPALLRSLQIIAGLALLAWAGWLGWQNTTDRPPLGYRWAAYNAELTALGEKQKHEDGWFVAREALREFPLNPQAYIWHLGFLRTFLGTEGRMNEAGRLAMYVDPVQPRTAAGVAVAWADIDDSAEASARAEAVRRAAAIDRAERRADLASAGGQIRIALEAAKDRPDVQTRIGQQLGGDPILVAYWLRSATDEPAQAMLLQIPDLAAFLANVPEGLRSGVLERLVNLPEPSSAVAYMESQSGAKGSAYWRQLARYYAKAGDKPRAVATVAKAAGVSLEGGGRGMNDFGRQLATLEGQGNDVSVRRLLAEALAAKKPDAEQLAVAMAWAAAAGDWDNAWRAASRLATETKIGE
jgi:O-antigen ligase